VTKISQFSGPMYCRL